MLGKGRSNVDSETNPFVVGRWKVIGSAGSKLTGIDKAKKKKRKKKRGSEKRQQRNENKKQNHQLLYVHFHRLQLGCSFFFVFF